MSDDEKDVFEEALDTPAANNEDFTTEISLSEPEIVDSSTLNPARTSVTTVKPKLSGPRDEKMVPRPGQFINIKVMSPEKIGSGIGSYFVYKVITNTNKPSFLNQEMIVKRRFSDFLGLHERLVAKYLSVGCIIPPAPEKDAFGNTKTKLSKEDQTNNEFLERRRGALERYLMRIANHTRLVVDQDFREFLEDDKDLPRSFNTQTLSGANMKKLIKNVGDAVGKITLKMEEVDRWFEDKQVEMDNLERHLTLIYTNFENMVIQRRELAGQTKTFAQYCLQLSHIEEHNGLARALTHLSSIQEEISAIEERQSTAEVMNLLELLKDYIGLVGAVKEVLAERIRQYRAWQDSESNLNKKREQKARLEIAGSTKADKIPALEAEIRECESRVDRTKEDFDNISRAIKKELECFDTAKICDFKVNIIIMLEAMIKGQEEIIIQWDKFAPETAGITS